MTVRAVRIDTPLRIDGRLDEAVYDRVASMSDFIQNDPVEGAPASEKTEVWLLFDEDQVYVVARCWESRPDRVIASEMRRDNIRIVRDDNFAWSFDTFYSRRNGVLFEVSAVGGRLDAEVVNESQINLDWNPVYDVAVARFEGGWAMETALPFKSLRYPGAGPQTWGFQARRVNRWRNESSYLTPLSAAQSLRGHFRASLAATLVGIDAPEASRLVEVKPYLIGDVTTAAASGSTTNDPGGDVGIDVKYGVTQGLTGDFTANPDFAQVEADEQQINLTRFNLFFPEKREFFLENQGTFSFGGASTSGRLAGVSDTPILFYSRRIGLHQTREVPLRAGGRLTGRAGLWTLGALNIQSGALPFEHEPPADLLDPRARDDEPPEVRPTNFTVLRAKRDVLRRSSVGAMFTGRSRHQLGDGSNAAYGVDGAFGFYDDLTVNTHWARTSTSGLTGNDTSYRGHLDYAGDRYGVQLEHLLIGPDFRPEVGFVRRRDMRRSFAELRFSPRPASIRGGAALRRHRLDRLRREPRRCGRDPRGHRPVHHRVGEQRPAHGQRHRLVRVPAPAVPHRARRRPPRRRLRLHQPAARLQLRPAAPLLGQRHGRARLVLRRNQDHPRHQPRPRHHHQPGLGRAVAVAQLDRSAAGQVPHRSRRHPGHLDDDPAHVRERPRAVQLAARPGLGQHPLPLGVPPRQRALRRLQRGPEHRARRVRTVPRPQQPGVHRQGEPAAPVLSGSWRCPPPAAGPPALSCTGLVKRYGDLTAVDGLDLTVHRGECFGLLGPNGAGKTTTIEILEGLLAPDAGAVEVLGSRWGRDDDALRQRLGIHLQETQFDERLTVAETLGLFRSFYREGRPVADLLETVGLESKAGTWVVHLSGGQRQRLAVGCALVGDPELLFLDEPTTGLDPQSRRQLWSVLQRFRAADGSILLTTHYMDEAQTLCDRVAVVDGGRIIAQGTPRELIASLGRPT